MGDFPGAGQHTPGPIVRLSGDEGDLASEAMPSEIRLGDRLGEYIVVDRMEGGLSDVYLCALSHGGDPMVALKTYRRELIFQPQYRRAFMRECALTTRLSGVSGFLPCLGIETIDRRPFMTMPAIQADVRGIVTLRDMIRRGAIPAVELVFIATCIAESMTFADSRLEGFVHGDLKPENIIFAAGTPHIIDLGLSTANQIGADLDFLPSTASYSAPELAQGGEFSTRQTDIYAFGIMLLEALQVATATDEQGRAVIAAVRRIADRCAAHAVQTRPSEFASIANELRSVREPMEEALIEREQRRALWSAYISSSEALDPTRPYRSLLDYGFPELVQEMISGIPADERTYEHWRYLGLSLSAMHQDDAALEAHDEAEKCAPDFDRLWGVRFDRAATHHHLGNAIQAERDYVDCICAAQGDELLSMAIHNYGLMLGELGWFETAEHLMHSARRISVGNALMFLGQAKLEVLKGEPLASIDWVRRAIDVAPDDPGPAIIMGEILMDDLEVPELAAGAFDRAIGCGTKSAAVLMRRVACAMFDADPEKDAEPALAIFCATYGETRGQILSDAKTYAALLDARRRGAPSPHEALGLAFEDWVLPRSWDLSGAPSARYNHQAPEPSWQLGGGAIVHEVRNGFFPVEIYQSLDDPDYLVDFTIRWRYINFIVAGDLLSRLSAEPFVVTDCGACGTNVATNHGLGRFFACQVCHQYSYVAPRVPRDHPVHAAMDQISNPGEMMELGGYRALLCFELGQQVPSDTLSEIRGVLRNGGCELIDRESSGSAFAIDNAEQRGLFSGGAETLTCLWPFPAEARGFPEATPRAVEILVERVRSLLPDRKVNSASYIHNPRDGDFYTRLLCGDIAGAEEVLAASTSSIDTVIQHQVLCRVNWRLGRFEQAAITSTELLQMNPSSAQAWLYQAMALFGAGRYADCLEACDQIARLDPAWVGVSELRGLARGALGLKSEAEMAFRQGGSFARHLIEMLTTGWHTSR